jgi:hypothetical protein
MTAYRPDLNPAPYATAVLEARLATLTRLAVNGLPAQRRSLDLQRERAIIAKELHQRRTAPKPRKVHATPTVTVARPSGPYASAVAAVALDKPRPSYFR